MSQDRLYKFLIWITWRLGNNLDLLVFKPLCSCFSVINCDTGFPLPGSYLIYPVYLYNFFLHFCVEYPCCNRRLFWYVFDSNWNYLRLQLVRFSHWTSYVQSPWAVTGLWLIFCGVVRTLHIAQCEKTVWAHDTMCPGVMYIVFVRAPLLIEKYFRFSQHMCIITYFTVG